MTENTWGLRRAQIGKQSVLNTAVPATLKLVSLMVTDEPMPSMHEYSPQGQWFSTLNEVGIEYSQHQVAGQPDYNDRAWAFANLFGNVSPTTPTGGGGAKSFQRVWTQVVDDLWTPMPVTLEIGSPERAEQYADFILKDWKDTSGADKYEQSGAAFGGAIVDNNALTGSLSPLPEVPIKGEQTKLYLDSANSAFGSTQLTRYFEHQWSLADVYAPEFPGGVNSTGGYGVYVQKKPKATGQLTLEADSAGMANLVTLRAGAYAYLRSESIGPVVENAYTVTIGAASNGTFTLTYNGQTTAGIAYNALASAVQTALQGLSSVGSGNALVTGSAGGPYVVSLVGTLLTSSNALTGSGAGLTGGSFGITHALINYKLRIDTAIKFGKPSAFKAVGSASALSGNDWPYVIVTDPLWTSVNASGQAFQVTLINAVAGF
jgi:hypothetical protein